MSVPVARYALPAARALPVAPPARTSLMEAAGGLPWALFIAAHYLIGTGAGILKTVAALHAAAVFPILLFVSLRGSPGALAAAGAYVVGSEVFWRMAGVPIPWESSKFFITYLGIVGVIRFRMGRPIPWLPVVYSLALLPSWLVVLVQPDIDTREALNVLSFNVSGPIALGAAAAFFSFVTIRAPELRRVLLMLVASTTAIAASAIYSTLHAPELVFSNESNIVTSGGFGPNQVSTSLGLGAMAALLFLIDRRGGMIARLAATGGVVLLAAQAAMTFSRGGLYNAAGAALVGALFMLGDRERRRTIIPAFLVTAVLLFGVVIPQLDAFTGGALVSRFEDTEPTKRGDLMAEDVQFWFDNPLLGIGPGRSKLLRAEDEGLSGHTEYSRMLGEHGTFGFISLLAWCAMALRATRRRTDAAGQGMQLAFLVWAALGISHAAMRIGAMAFMFGLAQARLETTDAPP